MLPSEFSQTASSHGSVFRGWRPQNCILQPDIYSAGVAASTMFKCLVFHVRDTIISVVPVLPLNMPLHRCAYTQYKTSNSCAAKFQFIFGFMNCQLHLYQLMNREVFYALSLMERLCVLPWFMMYDACYVEYCVTVIHHHVMQYLYKLSFECSSTQGPYRGGFSSLANRNEASF